MRSQKHNQTDLTELRVNIEKDIVEAFLRMSENTEIPVDDLVVIALKRFKSSHSDYLKEDPKVE